MNGWLKLHRCMKDHPVWQLSDGQFKVWITCLILANTKERQWDNKTDILTIAPGSFVTSLDHLAVESCTSIKTVRLALKALERIGSIRAQFRAQRYTLIELVNWPTYNGSERDEGTEEGIKRAQLGHSRGTVGALTEEGKKERRKRSNTLLANPEGFAVFWSAYPRKEGKQAAIKAWAKLQPQNGMVETILSALKSQITRWTDPQFIPHPATWLNGRRWEDVLVAPTTAIATKPDPRTIWTTIEGYQAARRAGRVRPGEIPEWEPIPQSNAASAVSPSSRPGGAGTA